MAKNNSTKKSKKNFIPISELDNVLIPGRHECDCEASIHQLICNCLNCGRIVCEQENVGPCFTCGENIIKKEELLEIIRKSKESIEFKEKEIINVVNRQNDKKQNVPMNFKELASSLIGIDEANEYKNRLLEYERTSEERTKVIDDELDYFDLTRENWLSDKKRSELEEKVEKLHEDKFKTDHRYELDLIKRQIVEYDLPKIKDLNEEVKKLKEDTEFNDDYEIVDFRQIQDNESKLLPYFIESDKINKKSVNNLSKKQKANIMLDDSLICNRLQNSELFESADEEYALSINQPWASFLVHQIKLHEGRSWSTTYRGFLWIHASAKSPRKEEIQEACSLFKLISADKPIQFPEDYPLGCIIGRAKIIDCLTQEEYQSKFGLNNAYIDDPYVFIFEDIIRLKVNVPCKGELKIFKLKKTTSELLSSQNK